MLQIGFQGTVTILTYFLRAVNCLAALSFEFGLSHRPAERQEATTHRSSPSRVEIRSIFDST